MKHVSSMLYAALGVVFGVLPSAVQAQSLIRPEDSQLLEQGSGLGTNSPDSVVGNVINILLGFLAFVAVILILYAGFTWMTAAGNEDKISTAKNTLIAAVIGLLIILAAWGISLWAIGALGSATGTTVY